jgi:hypothetical protein
VRPPQRTSPARERSSCSPLTAMATGTVTRRHSPRRALASLRSAAARMNRAPMHTDHVLPSAKRPTAQDAQPDPARRRR